MQATVALRGRGQLAAILNQVLQVARQAIAWHEPDARNMRTFRQLILAVLVKRSTRLIVLAQAVAPRRRAITVKSVAMSLAYFLDEAKFPMGSLSRYLLESILRRIPVERMATYTGKAIVVIDPTEYPERSRGKGKGDNYVQHIGRVRKSHSKRRRKKKANSNGKTKARAPGNASGQPEKTATIRFSRSGRKNDCQEAKLNFVELVPLEGCDETLVVATTLPVATLGEAKGIARVHSWSGRLNPGLKQ
ncbi:MAG: hypothetical protein M1358_22860 [Chloroflexi bacterium]|nr:hypothetical protein [Chloroflexota bacterium]